MLRCGVSVSRYPPCQIRPNPLPATARWTEATARRVGAAAPLRAEAAREPVAARHGVRGWVLHVACLRLARILAAARSVWVAARRHARAGPAPARWNAPAFRGDARAASPGADDRSRREACRGPA